MRIKLDTQCLASDRIRLSTSCSVCAMLPSTILLKNLWPFRPKSNSVRHKALTSSSDSTSCDVTRLTTMQLQTTSGDEPSPTSVFAAMIARPNTLSSLDRSSKPSWLLGSTSCVSCSRCMMRNSRRRIGVSTRVWLAFGRSRRSSRSWSV